jgi:hypothetical protein
LQYCFESPCLLLPEGIFVPTGWGVIIFEKVKNILDKLKHYYYNYVNKW